MKEYGVYRGTRHAFTLIEVLVVISIIALLLSILMPSLGLAKKRASGVVCRSNLKQWGLIFCLYTNDNEGKFQSMYDADTNPEGMWVFSLEEYYETPEIRYCPRASKPFPHGKGSFQAFQYAKVLKSDGEPDVQVGSYCLNNWIRNTDIGDKKDYFWRREGAGGAWNIPVFADGWWFQGYPEEDGDRNLPPEEEASRASAGMGRFAINRHEGYNNSLFMDWSARKVGVKELWTLKWHRKYNTSGQWTTSGGARSDDWPAWMSGFKDY